MGRRFKESDLAVKGTGGKSPSGTFTAIPTLTKLAPRKIERQHQIAVFDATAYIPVPEGDSLQSYCLMIPNSGEMGATDRAKAPIIMKILKAMGFRVGASDLLIFLPRGKFNNLWLEMKKPYKDYPSASEARRAWGENQRAFCADATKSGGLYRTAYGADHALQIIRSYLSGGGTEA